MKKTSLLFSMLLCSALCFSQSWQATNLTGFNYLAISSIENHDGNLMAIVFNGATGEVNKLNVNSTSWNSLVLNGITGRPAYLKSADTRLYVGTIESNFSSTLFYTQGNSTNFVSDTVGLPSFLNGKSTVYGLDYFEGKIVANLGSTGYWMKDTTSIAWQKMGVLNSFNGGIDPICFYNDTLFAYDNSGGYTLYISGDFGLNWTARATNLPSLFVAPVLSVNKTNGRLYVAGGKNDGSQYGIYYSDDNGFSWNLANLNSFIGTDVNGGQQDVIDIYAKGGTIYISLENDAIQTAPNVISSTTGIANVTYDILGLPQNDLIGAMHGTSFLEYNNQIAMALNVRDIYLKGGSSIGNDKNVKASQISIFPNPVEDKIKFTGITENKTYIIKLYNAEGELIRVGEMLDSEFNLVDLSTGIYILKIKNSTSEKQFKIFKK